MDRDAGWSRHRRAPDRGQGPRGRARATCRCVAPSGSPRTATASRSGSTSSTAAGSDGERLLRVQDPAAALGDRVVRSTRRSRPTSFPATRSRRWHSDGCGRQAADRGPPAVAAINVVAQREKIGHAALHPRKLHLWWARRPLAAARAAVYATLVPADGTPEDARSRRLLHRAVPVGRERPRDRRSPRSECSRPTAASRHGARPVRRRRRDPARGGAAWLRGHRGRAQPGRAPDRALHARLSAALRPRLGGRRARVRPAVGSSARGSASGTSTRACASHRASSSVSSTMRPPSAPRDGRSLTCGRAPCRARTPRAARTICRSCVRRGWRRRRAATSRCKPHRRSDARTLRWEVVEAADARGSASTRPASRAADARAVWSAARRSTPSTSRSEGLAGRMGITPLAAVLVKPSGRGRDYLPVGAYPEPSRRGVRGGARRTRRAAA